MYYHNPKERETKELAPGVRTRTFWGENLLMSMVEFDAGSAVPNHTHHHEQGGIMLEGELEMNIDGDSRPLKPGDVYIIPGNVEHWAKSGPSPARVMEIFSPVREEFKY